jgi:hypothetical protein
MPTDKPDSGKVLVDEPLPTINDFIKMEAEASAGLQ